ncbi:MAG: hypothetical protein U0931_29815 [Vulcanimicrobiota bacterium]
MKIFSGQVFSNLFSSKPKETRSDREYQRDILESHGWADPSERYERPAQQSDLGLSPASFNRYPPFAQATPSGNLSPTPAQDLPTQTEPVTPTKDSPPSRTQTGPEMYLCRDGLRSDLVTETRQGDTVLYSNGTVGFQVDNLVFNSDGTITVQL